MALATMLEGFVVVATIAVLFLLGRGLSALWDAGYWPLVVLFAPTVLAIAYALSSDADRAEFRRTMLDIITLRRWRR